MDSRPQMRIVFVVLIGLALMVNLTGRHHRIQGEMVGKTLGYFDIPELGAPGSHFTPKAWEGKVAIVNVFASWCTPCMMEYPLLLQVSKLTKVPIYGIAWKDTDANVADMLATRGVPFAKIAVDEAGKTTLPLRVRGIPETFVIDSKGTVVYQYLSALDVDEVRDGLLPALQQLAPDQMK